MLTAHRGIQKTTFTTLSIAIAALSAAQQLTLEEAIARGLSVSQQVRASEKRIEAARTGILRARAGFNPQIELAPGVGFTNSNFALSQRLDIGGVRRAETRLAEAEMRTAMAAAATVRQARALDVASLYLDLRRGRAEEAAAAESSQLTGDLVELVRKRVEIGEAPRIHATRAEIEAARVAQELVRARGAVSSGSSALLLLLDMPAIEVAADIPGEPATADIQVLISLALANRPELQLARANLAEAQATADIARSAGRPSLLAGVAADVWSLDRQPFQSRNVGLQLVFSIPLFDRGSIRNEQRRTDFLVRAAEAEIAAAEQTIRAEVTRLAAEFEASRAVAANYRTTILPSVQQLVEATRLGYQTGVTTLIEVLDAQRTARLTQSEYLTALFEALRAELELRRAAGTLAPPTQEPTK